MSDQARHYGGVATFGGSPAAPGNRTNVYAAKELLKFARAHDPFAPVTKKLRVPTNVSETAKWRRIVPDLATDSAITEGVNPDWQGISYEDVEATFEERVEIYAVTSRARYLSEDDHVSNTVFQLRDKVLRIRTAVMWAVFRAGTNVIYNDPTHTARNEVDGPVSLGILQEAVRGLHRNKADVFREVDNGGVNSGTVPVEPTYIGLSHTDILPDLRRVEGWTTTAEYGGNKQVHTLERGSVENTRFLLSPELGPFEDSGAAVGSTNMKASGDDIDVYPILICGREALGCADLMGKGKMGYGGVKVNIVDGADKADPANLNVLAVAHWFDADVILNDAWLVRLEVGATDNLSA